MNYYFYIQNSSPMDLCIENHVIAFFCSASAALSSHSSPCLHPHYPAPSASTLTSPPLRASRRSRDDSTAANRGWDWWPLARVFSHPLNCPHGCEHTPSRMWVLRWSSLQQLWECRKIYEINIFFREHFDSRNELSILFERWKPKGMIFDKCWMILHL